MTKLNLSAETQYDDYIGSIAFDDEDIQDLNSYLQKENLIEEREFILGFEVFLHPKHLSKDQNIDVSIHLGGDASENVRQLEIAIGLIDFLKLFKRVNFVAQIKRK